MRLWGGFEGSVHIKHLEQYLAGICVKSINITIAITIVTTFGLCKPLLCLHGRKSFRKGQANLPLPLPPDDEVLRPEYPTGQLCKGLGTGLSWGVAVHVCACVCMAVCV